jgi:hypothetical protein
MARAIARIWNLMNGTATALKRGGVDSHEGVRWRLEGRGGAVSLHWENTAVRQDRSL